MEDPEADHLDHHRQGDDDEQAADDHQQEVEVHQQAQRGQGRPDGQRAGVAHEDLGRRRVPPQEAEAGAGQGHRGQGQVQGVGHVVDAEVAVLPVPDDGQAGEAERRRTGGQAVQAVGEVHRVGRGGDDHRGPHHPQPGAHVEADRVVAGERQGGARRGPSTRPGARTPRPRPIWAPNLARLLSPRLRRWRTLIQSSANPISAAPTRASMTSAPEREKVTPGTAWAAR